MSTYIGVNMKIKTTKNKRPPHKPNCAECSITYGMFKETCNECWEEYDKEMKNQNEEGKYE